MGTSNYSDEFKRDAVQQIRVRGYPVREACAVDATVELGREATTRAAETQAWSQPFAPAAR